MPKVTKYPKGIRPNANGTWAIDVCVKGVRKTATAATQEEAINKRAELTRMLTLGLDAPASEAGGSWTLETAIQKTIDFVWAGTKSEDSAIQNATLVKRFFGPQTKLNTITPERIDDFVEWLLDRGIQYSTVNRKLNCLSRILRTAVDRGKLAAVPKMPRRKEGRGRVRFLTKEEETTTLRWMEYLERPDHLEATIILLDTGFRCSELWKLSAVDVNLHVSGRGAVTAWNPKNGRPRTIPMTARVRDILARRMEQYPTGQLFPGSNNQWYRLIWNRVRALMHMENDAQFIPHILRHTCCSRLVQRGFPLTHVQQWMGHLTIQTTMRYAHLAPQGLFSGAALLEGGDQVRWTEVERHSTGPDADAKPVVPPASANGLQMTA